MKSIKSNKSGFTLLEIIIVVIIVGVLASLALPKLFSTVEFSKSSEAFTALSALRSSIIRCGMTKGEVYTNCSNLGTQLDLPNPGLDPQAHFTYAVSGAGTRTFTITATRNTYDGGDGSSRIILNHTTAGITKSGTGSFQSI